MLAPAIQINFTCSPIVRKAYIRLSELIPAILQMVDEKKIAFNPAVELSYIPKELQTELFDIIVREQCTPCAGQVQRQAPAESRNLLQCGRHIGCSESGRYGGVA